MSRRPFEGVVLRPPGQEHMSRVRPDCLRIANASSILDRVIAGDNSWLQTAYTNKAEIGKGQKDKKKKGNRKGSGDISIKHFLVDPRQFLAQNLPTSCIDYVELTNDCNALLKHLVDNKIV